MCRRRRATGRRPPGEREAERVSRRVNWRREDRKRRLVERELVPWEGGGGGLGGVGAAASRLVFVCARVRDIAERIDELRLSTHADGRAADALLPRVVQHGGDAPVVVRADGG